MIETNYQQQAIDFLAKTGTTLEWKFSHVEDERLFYTWILKRGGRQANGNFQSSKVFTYESLMGESYLPYGKGFTIWQKEMFEKVLKSCNAEKQSVGWIADSGNVYSLHVNKTRKPIPLPSVYDLLACLQKHDVGTIDEFGAEYGHCEKISETIKSWEGCKKEYMELCALYNEVEMDELREIQ